MCKFVKDFIFYHDTEDLIKFILKALFFLYVLQIVHWPHANVYTQTRMGEENYSHGISAQFYFIFLKLDYQCHVFLF